MSSFSFSELPPHLSDGTDDRNNLQSTFLPTTSSMLNPASSTSPSLNNINTPAESVLSIHYQSSDFSELETGDDNYFNPVFNAVGGNAPSFLSDDFADFQLFATEAPATTVAPYATPDPLLNATRSYPISPDQTPSLPTSSPHRQPVFAVSSSFLGNVAQTNIQGFSSDLVAPDQLAKNPTATGPSPFDSLITSNTTAQLTPDTASSGESLGNNCSGSLAPEETEDLSVTAFPMASQNPYVTISHWGQDTFASGPSALNGDRAPFETPSRSGNTGTGRRGFDPSSRPTTEMATNIHEDAEARKIESQNIVVNQWLNNASGQDTPNGDNLSLREQEPAFEGVSDRDIDCGGETENVQQPGRTYYAEKDGPLTAIDREIMLNSHIWDDAPARQRITKDAARQPQTSQAAIEKFEKMYHDNASFLSRAATWGTRRRSLPSIADIEGITSGNFLKKLSLSRGDTRRPSILEGLRTLVRKPSTSQKRSRAHPDDESFEAGSRSGGHSFEDGRRDSSTLAPPQIPGITKNKQSAPSINSALVSMGSSVASIGTTHARKGSISRPPTGAGFSPPLTSPKSPLLKVSNSIRRPRSKSELSKATAQNGHPNLVRMLLATGGPPVAIPASSSTMDTPHAHISAPFATSASISGLTPIKIPPSKLAVPDPDDEDDEDDDILDDGDLKTESDELIDKISPDLNGFRDLVVGLNPMLTKENNFLVDRIAYQQIQRYKTLLNGRVKHLGYVKGRCCPSGDMCIEQGGSAVPLDGRRDFRGLDPASNAYDLSDIDDLKSPLDGAINTESFPKYIPMPPATTLPAEFECQLCFQNKRFQKPSDWTKHVHEDVMPFTCTWDRCREPKMFKRKADWVRHENEGHRHLEWWTCDVDECRHTCYRRDNFLQHLVREHKFQEPKHKTKAAIKKAGASDPTWHRVEQCHAETTAKPQDEPCRFCGKTFQTWKKLTVHLAKHMEHISLPILRLVERKEVDADTLISPVQDPPPRTFALIQGPLSDPSETQSRNLVTPSLPSNTMPLPQQATTQSAFHLGSTVSYVSAGMDSNTYGFASTPQMQSYYGQPQPPQLQSQFVAPTGIHGLDVASMAAEFAGPAVYGHNQMPVTSGSAFLAPATSQYISEPPGTDTSAFSGLPGIGLNALGLQPSLVASQMGAFDVMVDQKHFQPQGSVSSYSHSPHPTQGQFF